MFKLNRILSLIPARGGSKGIKNKNIIDLEGRPLIAYSIAASLASKYIDKTVVSTDSMEIAKIAKEYGASVPFMRPEKLASDCAKTIEAVIHAINMLEAEGEKFDILILLQPTQPLRTADDIDAAIELFFEKGEFSLVSVSLVEDHPLLIRTVNEDGNLLPLLDEISTCRRQDMKSYYKVNGCIYINRINELSEETSFNDNQIAFIMEANHSVDIDEMKDIYLAEFYLKNNVEKYGGKYEVLFDESGVRRN